MKTEIKEGNFELNEKLGAWLACLIKTESEKLVPGQPNLQLCLRYKNTVIQLTTEYTFKMVVIQSTDSLQPLSLRPYWLGKRDVQHHLFQHSLIFCWKGDWNTSFFIKKEMCNHPLFSIVVSKEFCNSNEECSPVNSPLNSLIFTIGWLHYWLNGS